MKLARYGASGAERPAVVDDGGRLRDLSEHLSDLDGEALSDEAMRRLAALDIATLPVVGRSVRLGPPVASSGRIICIGLNYRDHAEETGLPIPREPVVFLKGGRPSGPHDDIRLPRGSEKADWEVELAVVIGKPGLYVRREEALSHIAGYSVFNDVSERAYQMDRGGQWTKGKSFPGFAPLGPFLVTRDEIEDPSNLHLWLDVNGRRFQDSTTANLIFDVEEIVSYISQFFALEAGDIIATGTPSGVGLGQKPEPVFLKPGDQIALGIDGLGMQGQRILAWEE
ncbi:fumarylacetoacetate hydrolase family protein [Gluconacetobacter azotocaptans]|uniref:fumarylacetoacetate hydrolase family protein n=1 Tax=Gluconacetobacter azotocaptans TaxID=142834 RepID=UPI0019576F3B|nr:fumarylacetoacetate hydrolase family protein [Gluconacetobacter azotocaptans]MBM9401135.1 fumarylacetoacetate hydrolase family protein [Gluconacetobacter azotocaptans]